MTLDYGWVYIERGTADEMRLACASPWKIDIVEQNVKENIMHVVGDTHISISGIEEVVRTITLNDVIFKTRTDFETCIQKLRKLNNAGTMTLELAYSDTPDFIKFHATASTQYDTMEVKFLRATGLQKIARGAGTVYKCAKMMFEQGG